MRSDRDCGRRSQSGRASVHCGALLRAGVCGLAILCAGVQPANAQHPPSIGYMFPAGGQAGETVEVVLGGYDWTPDMQVFVHDASITLEITGPPSEILVPEPPFWFGAKGRRPPFPLPREVAARLNIPAGTPPGVVRWQAANANGASASGQFLVLDIDGPAAAFSVQPGGQRGEPLELAALPVAIAGQIERIEEVDRYRFHVDQSGPVTCSLTAGAVGSVLRAVLEVRDPSGRLVADVADTAGHDPALTFLAEGGQTYELSVYDFDFRGDRSLVYWLMVSAGPRITAAIPAMLRRGETRPVELIGYGVTSVSAALESVTRSIEIPAELAGERFLYRLNTPHGNSPAFEIMLSELNETIEPVDPSAGGRRMGVPAAITGAIEQPLGEDVYTLAGTAGDVWSIEAWAQRIGSPLDVAIAVFDGEGKELARADDIAGSTDAMLEFAVPADGDYKVGVADIGGSGGRRNAFYRLAVTRGQEDFTLAAPELLNVPIGGKSQLKLTATRAAGFSGAITISVDNLPPGVRVSDGLVIPEGKAALDIELVAADDAAANAALITLSGQASSGEQVIRRTAAAPVLVATTLKPPFEIDAEGKDDVTKWPRGSTFPAPVLIQRDAGFDGEIILEMTSRQGRHRQGIRGPDLPVPGQVDRILYPVFLPEWLETTRTSRMVVNGVAQIADPQGNRRYSVSRQKTRMGFLPTGALLKINTETAELQVRAGEPFSIPLTIHRAVALTEPVVVELIAGDTHLFKAEPQTLSGRQDRADLNIAWQSSQPPPGEYELTFRATALQHPELPVVSEATVVVELAER